MRTTLVSRPLLWLVLLAYSLCASIPGGGLVVCLESDGHVTLEVLGAGCVECCADGGGDGADPSADGARVESCPCVDVALLGLEAPQTKTKSFQTPAPAPCLAWRGPSWFACAPSPSVAPVPRCLAGNAPVELVKSVVLRV